jgi:Na+-driven multidrug efflux pump
MIVGVLHIFWCWVFIDFLNFGVKGSALASLVTSSMKYVLQTLYLFLVVKRDPKLTQAVGFPDKNSFRI